MSDPVSALGGVQSHGFATVREIGPSGMIMLRATHDLQGLQSALKVCTGTEIPEKRQILHCNGRSAGWMSPDEYLLILPYGETETALLAIAEHLGRAHHLAVSVSDARAMFRIEGAKADQVLTKLAPVDLQSLRPDELRRTRTAQVAAAFWRLNDGLTLVCYRSVARYVYDLLTISAMEGAQLESASPGT